MYPKPTRWERNIGRDPDVYSTIENVFYALRIDSPTFITENSKLNTSRVTYFSIITKVGVGAKSKGWFLPFFTPIPVIRNLHIRFRLLLMKSECPEPEIVVISPTDKLKIVGLVQSNQEISVASNLVLNAVGDAEVLAEPVGSGTAKASAEYERKKNLFEKKTYEYPNYIHIANASGVGNLANWEFYQGREKGYVPVGQYNVEIVFRIQKPCTQLTDCCEGSYCIDWNVEVNGRKVQDHDWDLEHKEWNRIFNGQRLRDTQPDKNKLNFDYNIPKPKIENNGLKSSDSSNEQKETIKMENIQNGPKSSHSSNEERLLRPLNLIM